MEVDKENGQLWDVRPDGIGIFDGFFTPQQCQFYIDFFNRAVTTGYGVVWNHKSGADVADDQRVNLWPPSNAEEISPIETHTDSDACNANDSFLITFQELIYPKYLSKMRGLSQMDWRIPGAKIQKTIPGGGYHAWHTEKSVQSHSDRIFVIMVYLNDILEGGETEFLCQHERIEPKQGRCVIFPAGYTHMHRGNPPLSGEKYILNAWAQYSL